MWDWAIVITSTPHFKDLMFHVSEGKQQQEIKENLQQGKLRNAAQIFKIEILKDYT